MREAEDCEAGQCSEERGAEAAEGGEGRTHREGKIWCKILVQNWCKIWSKIWQCRQWALEPAGRQPWSRPHGIPLPCP